MRRLFSRKGVDEGKTKKAEEKKLGKEQKPRRSIFSGKSHSSSNGSVPHSSILQTPNDSLRVPENSIIDSSASSAVSIPAFIHTPSASSSFSSITSETDSPSVSSASTAPSLSKTQSSGEATLFSSSSSTSSFSTPPSSRPSLSPLIRPSSSSAGSNNPKKALSPLSTQLDAHNLPTPPSSPSSENNSQDEHPKRRNSIYGLFRKAQSQPNLGQSAPSSRSNSTTTLPSTCMAPHMPSADLVPPAPPSRRHSIFLRKKSSNHSLSEISSLGGNDDGILSTDVNIAHRAILMGDPLGGGPYLYPTTKRPQPPSPGNRPSRGGSGRRSMYGRPGPGPGPSNYGPDNNTWRRNSWAGAQNGEGGAAWRKPRIGGGNPSRMVIEEEQGDMGEQQQNKSSFGRGEYIEDTPIFTNAVNNNERKRPPHFVGRSNSGHGYYHPPPQRSAHYPPFAPPPILPPISQYMEPPSQTTVRA